MSQDPLPVPSAPASAAAVAASLPPSGAPAHGAAGGYAAATTCFVIWGLVPLFWRQLAHVGAGEILVHRVLWSALFMAIALAIRGKAGAILELPLKLIGWGFLSATAVSLNWLTFIWAVNAGRVVETSLGYFLSPLVTAVLGVLFFRERLRPARVFAFVLATVAVATLVVRQGSVPWVALSLCLTWGSYSVLRKRMGIDPMVGLLLETVILAPIALAYLGWLGIEGTAATDKAGWPTLALLAVGGLVTSVPLVAFAEAARRLPLTGIAILQFITPSLTFLIGVFWYDEPFASTQAFAFGLIWVGIAVYVADVLRQARR